MKGVIIFFLILATILCIFTVIVVCLDMTKKREKKKDKIVYTMDGKAVRIKQPETPAQQPVPAQPQKTVVIIHNQRSTRLVRRPVQGQASAPVTVSEKKTVGGLVSTPRVRVNFTQAPDAAAAEQTLQPVTTASTAKTEKKPKSQKSERKDKKNNKKDKKNKK